MNEGQQPGGEGEPDATEEELAHAATKIGAAFRGKKARDEVAQIKAQRESERTDANQAEPKVEDDAQPVEEAKEEEAPADNQPAAEETKQAEEQPPADVPAGGDA